MEWKIISQYMPKGRTRPRNAMQDDELQFPLGLPNVGDTVDYKEDGQIVTRKVLTRHFSATGPYVNIVVTDLEPDEMAARIKE